MKVQELMTDECEIVSLNETLRSAAEHMRDADVGMLLVEDDKGEVCGVLTDRDIAIRAVANGRDPNEPIEACITRELISVHENDSIEDAAQLMEQEQVRRLLVCDQNDRPVGVLGQADLARGADNFNLVGQVLHEVSQPQGRHWQH